jgi:TetR/AcrR family transcriptional regulator, tetracycline repressor protein
LVPAVIQTIEKRKSSGRGRPPKTSREAIVTRAIAILEREPDAGISINRIAREIGIAPMAIYNYFANRDALLQAVTEAMMAGLELPPASGTWEQQLAAWATSVRAHFRRYPHLIHLLSWEGHASTAWLKHSALIIELLAAAGIEGRELARLTLWVWGSIMGAINEELFERDAPRTLGADELAQLDEPLRGRMRDLLRFTRNGRHHDDLFAFNLERIIATVAAAIAASGTRDRD